MSRELCVCTEIQNTKLHFNCWVISVGHFFRILVLSSNGEIQIVSLVAGHVKLSLQSMLTAKLKIDMTRDNIPVTLLDDNDSDKTTLTDSTV
jgi:hypothetical protein